jgi:hypothetical protein
VGNAARRSNALRRFVAASTTAVRAKAAGRLVVEASSPVDTWSPRWCGLFWNAGPAWLHGPQRLVISRGPPGRNCHSPSVEQCLPTLSRRSGSTRPMSRSTDECTSFGSANVHQRRVKGNSR